MDPVALLPKKRHRYVEQMRNPNVVSNPGRLPFLFNIPRLKSIASDSQKEEITQVEQSDADEQIDLACQEHFVQIPIEQQPFQRGSLDQETTTNPLSEEQLEMTHNNQMDSNKQTSSMNECDFDSSPESPLMVDPSQLVCPLTATEDTNWRNQPAYDYTTGTKTPCYFCEWTNCACNSFDDLTLFLSHLKLHLREIQELVEIEPEPFTCMWSECREQFSAEQIDDFYLHLTYHGYHSKLMSIGALELRLLSERVGRTIQCFMDSSSRTLLPGLPDAFVCGWKDCLTSFSDAESFYRHVGRHPFEDVKIPAVSKEQLRRTRFANCDWNECKASFNSRSRLRDHLRSHTQEKTVACPNCGSMFFNRVKFHDHLFRQLCNEEEQRQLETLLLHVSLPDDEKLTLRLVSTVPKGASGAQAPSPSTSADKNSTALIKNPIVIQKKSASNQEANDGDISSDDSDDSSYPRLTIEQFVERNTSQYDPDDENENGCVDIQNAKSSEEASASASTNDKESHDETSDKYWSSEKTDKSRKCKAKTSKPPLLAFDCPHCEKSLPTSSLLTEHLRSHRAHWKCNVCGYRTNSYSSLTHHVVYRHSNLRPFACQFCEAKFKSRSDLRKHIDIHSDEHPYKCPLCSFKCRCCHTLAKHRKKEHEEAETVYQCHLCRRTFTRGNNLSRHLSRSHQFPLPEGRTRFTYKRDDDGVYRLATSNQIIES